jgi:hypothetical protein
MATRRRQTASFRAEDAAGNSYLISVFSTYDDAGTSLLAGRDELCTSSGLSVTRLQKGKYKIDETGVLLSTDAAAAP